VSTVLVLQAHLPNDYTLILTVHSYYYNIYCNVNCNVPSQKKKHNRWLRNYVITLFFLFILYKGLIMDWLI